MKRYNPSEIEPKWQKKWADDQIYQAKDFDSKPKYVMLTEFPYPSGEGLHIGHVREYALGDIMARHKRMQGYNVLYPMGYDAFGLPTENFAIRNKIAPQVATARNVTNFRRQFDDLGLSIDWSREINTTDPAYYKWTQWLFLQFFKHDLAYQDDIDINWCPKCKTGLANEEVTAEGLHERCDNPVEKKKLKQWMLKITAYADTLIDGLETVDYPTRISSQQINWIGRSHGAEIDFAVDAHQQKITTFTTRPDTLFGASFVVLAPEHPLVLELVSDEQRQKVMEYIATAKAKTDFERQDQTKTKTGVPIRAFAIHPLTGDKLPIWISDYVMMSYGAGALMAVPAHDERDHQFATKFDLPIVEVITKPADFENPVYTGDGKLINSGEFDGFEGEKAREAIVAKLESLSLGSKKVNYRLRDWIFSRQHYWGEPIPIIHCPKCGVVPVPEEDLPVELPKVDYYEPTDDGESPLSKIDDWVNVKCPACGADAKRETDTMPNWAGSSWYYLRYYDPHNDKAFADADKLKYWGEVDMYLGGMEHTTLHLLYSRFWHHFLYDIGLVPTPEPYAARRGQGIVLAADGSKMSKSKGNVVNPDEIIKAGYGADALRICIAFLAPFDQTVAWQPDGVPGAYRFLNRVWNLTQEFLLSEQDVDNILESLVHKTIKKVSDDLDEMHFNTAVAALMEFVNQLYLLKSNGIGGKAWREAIEVLLKLTAPFAPHLTEELWQQMGHNESIHLTSWPKCDKAKLVDDEIAVVVQVNGKVRAELSVSPDINQEELEKLALEQPNVQKFTSQGEVIKTIFVPKKLINIVVK